MDRQKIIMLEPGADYIIAHATVSRRDLLEKTITGYKPAAGIKRGIMYDLYVLNCKHGTFEPVGNEDEEIVGGDRVCQAAGDTPYIEMYWIKKGDSVITVPWGIPSSCGKPAINGQLEFRVCGNSIDSFFSWVRGFGTKVIGNYAYNGLGYEFVSEFFVDAKGNMCGIAIALRDLLLEDIRAALSKVDYNCKEKVEGAIRGAVKKHRDILDVMQFNGDTPFKIFKAEGEKS